MSYSFSNQFCELHLDFFCLQNISYRLSWKEEKDQQQNWYPQITVEHWWFVFS